MSKTTIWYLANVTHRNSEEKSYREILCLEHVKGRREVTMALPLGPKMAKTEKWQQEETLHLHTKFLTAEFIRLNLAAPCRRFFARRVIIPGLIIPRVERMTVKLDEFSDGGWTTKHCVNIMRPVCFHCSLDSLADKRKNNPKTWECGFVAVWKFEMIQNPK